MINYYKSITIEYDMTDKKLSFLPLPIIKNPLEEFMGENYRMLTEQQKRKALEIDLRVRYDWSERG